MRWPPSSPGTANTPGSCGASLLRCRQIEVVGDGPVSSRATMQDMSLENSALMEAVHQFAPSQYQVSTCSASVHSVASENRKTSFLIAP